MNDLSNRGRAASATDADEKVTFTQFFDLVGAAATRSDSTAMDPISSVSPSAELVRLVDFSHSFGRCVHDIQLEHPGGDDEQRRQHQSRRGEAHDTLMAALKASLTCGICGALFSSDPSAADSSRRGGPAIIETCGHCFCRYCIGSGLERGCALRSDDDGGDAGKGWPWRQWLLHKSAASTAMTAKPSAHASRKRRRQPQFACPLCGAPAFRWTLVPLLGMQALCDSLAGLIPGLGSYLTSLPPPSPSGTWRQEEQHHEPVTGAVVSSSPSPSPMSLRRAAFALESSPPPQPQAHQNPSLGGTNKGETEDRGSPPPQSARSLIPGLMRSATATATRSVGNEETPPCSMDLFPVPQPLSRATLGKVSATFHTDNNHSDHANFHNGVGDDHGSWSQALPQLQQAPFRLSVYASERTVSPQQQQQRSTSHHHHRGPLLSTREPAVIAATPSPTPTPTSEPTLAADTHVSTVATATTEAVAHGTSTPLVVASPEQPVTASTPSSITTSPYAGCYRDLLYHDTV